ncbi:MAG: hypothetical protein KBG16_02690 [Methanospirillum sp.]|jgi:hypothetical protein|nr:hypothetical protein [Methanospirillum sp.]
MRMFHGYFWTNPHLIDENDPTGLYTWDVRNPGTGQLHECLDRAIRWIDDRIV